MLRGEVRGGDRAGVQRGLAVQGLARAQPGKELPFTTAMTPHGSGQPTTHLGGQSLCVNANTEHVEEAWKLMQWLNSWEFFENYNTSYYPAQKSLLAKRPFPPR